MKELTTSEIQSVSGGLAPLGVLAVIAGSYALGWIGGYVQSKYEQSRASARSSEARVSGCAPTC